MPKSEPPPEPPVAGLEATVASDSSHTGTAAPPALVVPDLAAQASDVWARYEDLGPIGEGAMGEVRRVHDRTLNLQG